MEECSSLKTEKEKWKILEKFLGGKIEINIDFQ
jgi:hypothetical protein